ncbi:MAG: PAQR family membrane homeostasis protein TrhA [Candidatus Muiribacteriota bacterium]
MYKGERFNSISHLVGTVLSFIGLIVLMVIVSYKGDIWQIVSFSIYGSSLFLVYLCSTLYHSFRGKAKTIFKILDHNAIYLLIAGTYTPFTLVLLRGPWGWTIFGIAWGLALIGIIYDTIPKKSSKRYFAIALYLLMGWLIVIAIRPLLLVLPLKGFILLFIGGIFYSTGVIFYVFDKKITYFHGIWHLFVLAGSIFHYLAIVGFLI